MKSEMSASNTQCCNEFQSQNFTNDEVWQIEHIPPYGKTERARYGVTRWLEQDTVGIYALSAVLKRMRSEVLPVFNHRLVFE